MTYVKLKVPFNTGVVGDAGVATLALDVVAGEIGADGVELRLDVSLLSRLAARVAGCSNGGDGSGENEDVGELHIDCCLRVLGK